MGRSVRDNFDWRDLRDLGKLAVSTFSIPRIPSKECAMSQSPQVPPKEFVESVREEVEHYLEQVMDAVNQAPDGAWISGSEEKVRDLVAAMRQRVFEKAVQKRIDAAEAAFPPSASSDDGQATRR
jgi:hypothetical protein